MKKSWAFVKKILLGRGQAELRNQRQRNRLPVSAPVKLRVGEQDLAAELLDISPDGARIHCATRPRLNREVRLSSLAETGMVGRQRLLCRTVWIRRVPGGYEVGLEFCDTAENLQHSWIQVPLAKRNVEHQRREYRRIAAGFYVSVEEAETRECGVCVDLSPGGCLLRLERPLRENSRICLRFGPGADSSSIVLWGWVVGERRGPNFGEFLHHVKFCAQEGRYQRRLRNWLQTLVVESNSQEAIPERLEFLPQEKPAAKAVAVRKAPQPPPPPTFSDSGWNAPRLATPLGPRPASLWAARTLPVSQRKRFA